MATVEDILRTVTDLPALPAVAAKVSALMMDATSGMGDIEKLVRQDEALAGAILKAGNSAAYGAAGKTFTLQQSLSRMGRQSALRTVMGLKTSAIMERGGDSYGLRRRSLWLGSMFGALAAEAIAKATGQADPSLAYLCALMRDIGKLAVDAYTRRSKPDAISGASAGSTPFIEAERLALGADHAVIGAALAKKWNLPELVCNAIRYHHEPPANDPEHNVLFDIVHAGDVLCLGVGLGVGHDGLKYKVAPHVRRSLLPNHAAAAEYTAAAWTALCVIDPDAMSPMAKGAGA